MRWRASLAILAPLLLVTSLSACAEDKDEGSGGGGGDDKREVTLFGPEVDIEAEGLENSFKEFEKETGIDVVYQGDRSFEEQIGVRVDGNDAPDIAMFPQPGKIADFADKIAPLNDDVVAEVEENFDAGWTDFVTVDGDVLAVPAKADLKSLVWYSPEAFTAGGYAIPETFDDFLALTDKMAADGKTVFCVGLGSDAATGWPFTDWVEDYMLRLKGPEVYDQWRKHEIPFNDPDVIEVGEAVQKLWSKPNFVFGGVNNAAATPFAEAGLPLLDGDCMLHRQGNFYSTLWPEDTELGPEGAVDAFYLPGNEEFGDVTLSGGMYATAFSDDEDTMKVMEFFASTDYADTRAKVSGYLSPNKNVDASLYPSELEQNFGEILANADPVRFDASDLMPGAVGSGSFWTAAVDITTGKSVKDAFDEVEASWPED
jgi:alpha-glucoside transport system substrate-binding protein